MTGRFDAGASGRGLLQRASRALFWNASMLPLITAINLLAAVMIRRGFGLESGAYDVALGLMNTLLAHSALGVPMTIGQFVPALERTAGPVGVSRFVARVGLLRVGLLLPVLVLLNVYASAASDALALGAAGVVIIRVVSVLAVLRAVSDMAIKALQAKLAHFLGNLVQLGQALALAAAVAVALGTTRSIPSLFVMLTVMSVPVAAAAAWLAWTTIRREMPGTTVARGVSATGTPVADNIARWPAVRRFALFMYTFDASNYFATPAFASVALAAFVGIQGTIALFNVAFQIPLMIVTVLLAGFQGLYRPLFAGVLAEGSTERLRAAFSEISKIQTALLVPAGLGLGLLLPDVIALLFTSEFAAAAPLARVLCALLFAEALFNLGSIILSVDQRYAVTMAAQAVRIAGAPVFVWLAMRGDLLAATTAFGAGRLLAALFGFVVARGRYGLRYPWAFTGRVVLASAPMAAAVAAGRLLLPAGWMTTGLLTVGGIALTLLGARVFRVLGEREAGLLVRAGLPGSDGLVRWLAPRREEARC